MAIIGKSNYRFPASVEQLDWSKVHNSQLWVMSDWMGCRRQVAAIKSAEEQRTYMKARCLENVSRAQQGYEIILLQKDPTKPGTTVAPETEKRMYELLTDVVMKHRDSMGEHASKALTSALDDVMVGLKKQAHEIIKEAAEKRAPIVIKEAGKTRKVEGVLPPEFKRMIELASARIPILLVGPAGCGKTFLCEKLAEALDLEYGDQSCSEGMSESVFNGRLLPIGAGGSFKHVNSPFMVRYEKGGVFLLDEMDAGDPNLFTYINKAIAQSTYTVEQRFENPVVKKHKAFVLIAAANTYGNGADAMYVGRNQLDAATLDRFRVGLITMDYNRDVEASLAPQELCEWAWRIREKITAHKLRRIMSTRVIKDFATMTEQYKWTKEDWERVYFTGWTAAERSLVMQTV